MLGEQPIEILNSILTLAALIIAILALRANRQANHDSKDAELMRLKLRVHDANSLAEQSLTKFLAACNDARRKWDKHNGQFQPTIRFDSYVPDEIKRNAEIERRGQTLLRSLKDQRKNQSADTFDELQAHLNKAQQTALEIDRLSLGLEHPRAIRHPTFI